MIKTLLLLPLFLIVSLLLAVPPDEQPLETLLWSVDTDQQNGFWHLDFSTSEKYIIAVGTTHTLILDPTDGHEIKRWPGDGQVVFIGDNDESFLQISGEGEIFIRDFETLDTLGSLQHDGREASEISLSSDGSFVIGSVDKGLRVWDLESGMIIQTTEDVWGEDTKYLKYENIQTTCKETDFFVHYVRTEAVTDSWGNEYDSVYAEYQWRDINSLEIVGTAPNTGKSKVSNNCTKIAGKSFFEDRIENGLLIYDYATGELERKVPLNGPSLGDMEFSSDDRYLMTSNTSGVDIGIRVWDTQTWQPLYRMQASYVNLSVSDNNLIVSNVAYRISLLNPNPYLGAKEEVNIASLFPNPASTAVNISGLPYGNYTIRLYDMAGNMGLELFNGYVGAFLELPLTDYAVGNYVMSIEGERLVEEHLLQIIGE